MVYLIAIVNLESQIKNISYEELSARLLDEEIQIVGVEESKEDSNAYLTISESWYYEEAEVGSKGTKVTIGVSESGNEMWILWKS